MAKLVFIHGRGQRKKNHEKLRQQWITALNSGLTACNLTMPEGTEIALPFYGIELDQLRKDYVPGQLQTRGEDLAVDAPLYLDLLTELAENAGVTQDEIQRHMDPELIARGLKSNALTRALGKALDNKFTGDFSLNIITRDVFDYLTKPAITQVINKLVLHEVGTTPCVVVGHSLGSVIGYNILAEYADELDVQSYVTVGSPLGLRAMGTHIFSPITMPECIRDRWFNAYDRKDVVALKPLIKNYFDIEPEPFDYGLVNNSYDDHHGIEGYLGDPAVAQEIYDQLKKLG